MDEEMIIAVALIKFKVIQRCFPVVSVLLVVL